MFPCLWVGGKAFKPEENNGRTKYVFYQLARALVRSERTAINKASLLLFKHGWMRNLKSCLMERLTGTRLPHRHAVHCAELREQEADEKQHTGQVQDHGRP